MQNRKPKYRFYATLLDGFQDYKDSDIIWEKYWGWSENPPHTPEEFQQKQFQSLIDRINRLPFDSEAADKGTCFNEIVDCLIENRAPDDRFQFEKLYRLTEEEGEKGRELSGIRATYNNRTFDFDISLCREFADYYEGALTQQFVKAILPTAYGDVELYGYIDELMPTSVHDIKTTGSYSVGKFKNHWQHRVYPYCLQQNGSDISQFEYNIVELPKYGNWQTYTETYAYVPERDIPIMKMHCEELIRFLIENRELITDKKIFNEL